MKFYLSPIKYIYFIVSLVILLSFSNSFEVLGQEGVLSNNNPLPSIIPPTPEAFALGRFGSNPIGLYTGTTSYTLPLYNVKVNDFNLPISISYSSNGVKVDEVASRIGLQWKMDFGGVINRSVIGDPDEFTSYRATSHDIISDQFYNFLKGIAYGGGGGAYEPDQFSYSFPGYSGKFIIDNGRVIQIPQTNLKIEAIGFSKFIITTPNGIVYVFDITESSVSGAATGQSLACYPQTLSSLTATAWYLSSITLPTGAQIKYVYERQLDNVKCLIGINQTYTFHIKDEDNPNINLTDPPITTCYQMNEYTPVLLKEVQFPSGKIKLFYTEREDVIGERKVDSLQVIGIAQEPIKRYKFVYFYSNSSDIDFETKIWDGSYSNSLQAFYPELRKRLFLSKVENYEGLNVEDYAFEYELPNSLPPRLSYAQDYWGYFNGQKNNLFFPAYTSMGTLSDNGTEFGADRTPDFASSVKGLLKRITYPTGGYTDYTYEIDPPSWPLRNKPFYDTLVFSGTLDPIHNYFESGFFNVYNTYPPKIEISTNAPPLVINNDPTAPQEPLPDTLIYISLKDAAGTPVFTYNQSVWRQAYFPRLFLGNPDVGLKLSVQSTYPPNVQFTVRIFNPRRDQVFPQYSVGGVRVKSICDFDGGGQIQNKKIFEYDWSELQGSANSFPDDEGQFYSTSKGIDPNINAIYHLHHITSNSSYPLYLNEFGTLNYPKVTEKWVDNTERITGGIEHSFLVKNKVKPIAFGGTAEPESATEYNSHIVAGARYSNTDLHNGVELENSVFKLSGTNTKQYISKVKNFYSVDDRTKITDTFYAVKPILIRPSLDNTLKYFGDYDVNRYFVYSNWMHLDSSLTKTYTDVGDSLSERQSFNYDNIIHMQPSLVTNINSKNEAITLEYKYPHNYSSIEPYATMINRNIIVPVVEQRKVNVQHNQEIFYLKTNYQGWLNNQFFKPVAIQNSFGGSPLKTILTANSYDSNGNILEQTKLENIKEVYLWGYNAEYPIAKIVGSDYNTVIQYVNQDVLNNTNNYSADQVRVALNNIRVNLPKALVSTYTYAPLIGMTSETDPSGKTIYYEYDGLGRLALVRDRDGNIIKKYRYQYLAQPGQ